MAHDNSPMAPEFESGLANATSLAAFLTDIAIFNSNNNQETPAPSLNSEEVTDICMGEQGTTFTASISPGEFVPQGSSELPAVSLSIIPVEYHSAYPQHTFMQVSTLTTTLDLEAYIIKTRVNDITYYFCGYPECGHKGRFDTSSSSTVWGPGALSGKALKTIGMRGLDLLCHLAIRMRLAKIKRAIEKTPHVFHDPMDAIESQRINEYHSDLKELCDVKYSLSVRRAAGDLIRKITLIETPERPSPASSSVVGGSSRSPSASRWCFFFLEEVNPPSFRPHLLRGLHSESLGDPNQINDVLRATGDSQEDRLKVLKEVNPSSFRPHSLRGLHYESLGDPNQTDDVKLRAIGELILAPFEGRTDCARSVAFSHDGKRIVSGSRDNTIRVWNADTRELISAPFEGHTDWAIRVWNADTGKVISAPFEGHTDWVMSVAFSHDGKRIVSGSFDKAIRVWNADSGEVISAPFKGHTHLVSSVAFSHDGKRIISGSDDKTIRVWNADTGEVISAPFAGRSPSQ
ncbi:hypothetical protein JB92DRAFT_3149242 [Gautieria morchelliformis]|nr:hypothetical protein JB92DRAFT_3149242 [Gautieria morchelliformis]